MIDRRFLLMLLGILLISFPAAAKPVAIKADCKSHKVSASLIVTACYRAEPLSQLTLELAGAAKAVKLVRDINPEGTFDERVNIDDHDDRMVSLSYENSECTVALLIKRDDGSILADSGCTNSQYCTIPKLPAKDGCVVAIHCGDGTKGKPARRDVGLCAAPTSALLPSAAMVETMVAHAVLSHPRVAPFLHSELAANVPLKVFAGPGLAAGAPALQVAGKSVVMVAEAEARVVLIAKETLDATSVRVKLRIPPEGVIGHVDVALRDGVWTAVAADIAER